MSLIEVKVPDIGDFKEIPVIEVLVKAGDTVEKEQSLVTLESDKATMDVPSSEARRATRSRRSSRSSRSSRTRPPWTCRARKPAWSRK